MPVFEGRGLRGIAEGLGDAMGCFIEARDNAEIAVGLLERLLDDLAVVDADEERFFERPK